MLFVNNNDVQSSSWQFFERLVTRVLIADEYSNVRMVGQSNDHGADVIATKYNKRWLFQVKRWKNRVGPAVLDETIKAATVYHAQIPVVVASNGFDSKAKEQQIALQASGIPIQLWGIQELQDRILKIGNGVPNTKPPRPYQESAITNIVSAFIDGRKRSLAVMATGLGKTFVAAESIRRIQALSKKRVLILAHTNPLVYQLEQSFWNFMTKDQRSVVWNSYESPSEEQLYKCDYVFACVNSVADYVLKHDDLPPFDIVIVDECHHCGASMYTKVLDTFMAGREGGAYLLGLTATPWRADEKDIEEIFGETVVCIDMVTGMRNGYLANVDYRLYTDNIDWDSLLNLNGKSFTAKQINKTLFINQWDDSVVFELRKVWNEQKNPRAIVFCGTIEHALIMQEKLNALGFCNAEAIFSQANDMYTMNQFERNRILTDFADGIVNVVCTVDIFNEGIDVPDVNILVFQRVTHSRRIFIQQLGRGLRISEGKEKVVVLDFVSDIRRFAAGIDLKDSLSEGEKSRKAVRIDLPNKVTFRRTDGADPETEEFLREWLDDIAAIEDAGENSSVLKFPPVLPESKR